MNNVFVLSGPSGSGQDSIIESFSQEEDVTRVITTTTRPKRPTESEGSPYHFVSHKKFKEMQEANLFIEAAQSYNSEWYGVTVTDLETAFHCPSLVIWKVDYKGVKKIKSLYPDITTILIEVPEHMLRTRLLKRDQPNQKYLDDRMRYTEEWNAHKYLYDYCIQNEDGQLEKAISQFKKIISEKRRALNS